MMRCALRQLQRHNANVLKASEPKQIKHCDERPLAHVYCTSRYQDCKTYTVLVDGQLEGLQYDRKMKKKNKSQQSEQ